MKVWTDAGEVQETGHEAARHTLNESVTKLREIGAVIVVLAGARRSGGVMKRGRSWFSRITCVPGAAILKIVNFAVAISNKKHRSQPGAFKKWSQRWKARPG